MIAVLQTPGPFISVLRLAAGGASLAVHIHNFSPVIPPEWFSSSENHRLYGRPALREAMRLVGGEEKARDVVDRVFREFEGEPDWSEKKIHARILQVIRRVHAEERSRIEQAEEKKDARQRKLRESHKKKIIERLHTRSSPDPRKSLSAKEQREALETWMPKKLHPVFRLSILEQKAPEVVAKRLKVSPRTIQRDRGRIAKRILLQLIEEFHDEDEKKILVAYFESDTETEAKQAAARELKVTPEEFESRLRELLPKLQKILEDPRSIRRRPKSKSPKHEPKTSRRPGRARGALPPDPPRQGPSA